MANAYPFDCRPQTIVKQKINNIDSLKVKAVEAWKEACADSIYFDSESEDTSARIMAVMSITNGVICDNFQFSFKSRSERANYEQNCVGLSDIATQLINYQFKRLKIKNAQAYHIRGQLYMCGMNITAILGKHSSFFQDHDWVVVKSKSYGSYWLFFYDPSWKVFGNIPRMDATNYMGVDIELYKDLFPEVYKESLRE